MRLCAAFPLLMMIRHGAMHDARVHLQHCQPRWMCPGQPRGWLQGRDFLNFFAGRGDVAWPCCPAPLLRAPAGASAACGSSLQLQPHQQRRGEILGTNSVKTGGGLWGL